ncbi:MAG TPA: hypothetical protein VGD08_00650 [Stellaceae bacterium]
MDDISPSRAAAATIAASAIYEKLPGGKFRLPPHIHPMPDLLQHSAEEVVAIYRENQYRDFMNVFGRIERDGVSLIEEVPVLARALARHPDTEIVRTLSIGRLRELFAELHDHVMEHPVWLHPFFIRFFDGNFTHEELQRFARQYFNQIKNTRQCVAIALGRFNSLMPLPFGPVNEISSEMTQIVLAGLLADEYGTTDHSAHGGELQVRDLFSYTTHIAMFRQLFDGIGVPEERHNTQLLHGTADNVLTQRLLAGHEAFDTIEALASVGLGMEWGVPAFFSLLLGGIIRYADRDGLEIAPQHLEVLTAHVRQDVTHAIAVMLVTGMLATGRGEVERIKNATNMLMSSRYQMMSETYEEVFEEPCLAIDRINLHPRHHVADRRIAGLLREARTNTLPSTVRDHAAWTASERVPFVFAA